MTLCAAISTVIPCIRRILAVSAARPPWRRAVRIRAEKLADAEGLVHIVVGAKIEGGDLFGLAVTSREHDDRYFRPGREPPGSPPCHPCREGQGRGSPESGAVVAIILTRRSAGFGARHLVAASRETRLQETLDLRLVVDDEDALPAAAILTLQCLFGESQQANRKPQSRCRGLSQPAFRSDLAAHRVDEPPCDGKPEARSRRSAVALPRRGRTFRNMRSRSCFGIPWPIVGHRDHDRVSFRAAARCLSTRRPEHICWHCREVEDDLFQQMRIAPHQGNVLRHGECDAAAPAKTFSPALLRRARHRRDRPSRAGDRVSRFQVASFEKIGDEIRKPLLLPRSPRADRRALSWGILLAEAAQARYRAEDGGERRTQIMRERGQQRRAQPLALCRGLALRRIPTSRCARWRSPSGRGAHRACDHPQPSVFPFAGLQLR